MGGSPEAESPQQVARRIQAEAVAGAAKTVLTITLEAGPFSTTSTKLLRDPQSEAVETIFGVLGGRVEQFAIGEHR